MRPRKVTEYVAQDGTKTYRVRYRSGAHQHSATFRRPQDANTFATLLDNGGVADALQWLNIRDTKVDAPTFGEFFETYVDQLTGVTIRTRDDYRAQKRRYLTELDHLPLTLITRAHVTSIVNRLEREGRSPKTIKNAIHMLSSCFGLAVYEGHMPKNVCQRITLPKEGVNRDRVRFLTHDEFGALYAATPDHYRPLLAFMVGTGLRWSEATALQTRHVDLAAGTVHVEQAWKRVRGVGWEMGAPKSAKSWRTVNAATGALLAAKPLLRRPRDYVFTTPNGNVVRHANFYGRVWQPACIAAGLGAFVPSKDGKPTWDGPSPHDLRHSHASWLISDGVSLEAVQDQLGHESILTTRQVYGHLLPAIGVETGRSASAGLARALGHPVETGPLSLGSVQRP